MGESRVTMKGGNTQWPKDSQAPSMVSELCYMLSVLGSSGTQNEGSIDYDRLLDSPLCLPGR